jgi:hypothetical protein
MRWAADEMACSRVACTRMCAFARVIVQDERFSKIHTDPRFRRAASDKQKVKVDKRFEGMFNDPEFGILGNVDKYGRKRQQTTKDALKKYYRVGGSSDEEDAEQMHEEGEAVETMKGKSKGKSKATSNSTLAHKQKKQKKQKRAQPSPSSEEDREQAEDEAESESEVESERESGRAKSSREMFPAAYGNAGISTSSSEDEYEVSARARHARGKKKRQGGEEGEGHSGSESPGYVDYSDSGSSSAEEMDYGEETCRLAVVVRSSFSPLERKLSQMHVFSLVRCLSVLLWYSFQLFSSSPTLVLSVSCSFQ